MSRAEVGLPFKKSLQNSGQPRMPAYHLSKKKGRGRKSAPWN